MSELNGSWPWNIVREQVARLMGLASVEVIGVEGLDGLRRGETGAVLLKAKRRRFGVQFRSKGDTASVAAAVLALRRRHGGGLPLVVVPYMGEAGRRVCEEAGIGWFDLCGNAHLEMPGLRVHVEGKPNRFKRPGRPGGVFAPKSARIARWLLMHPEERFSQDSLARATGMGKGFVSRIVRALEEKMLIVRDEQGAVRPRDCKLLLDAWREVYDFSRHQIVRGHVAARSSGEILRRLHDGLEQAGVPHAATGLAAAWLWTAFSGHRLVAVYVAELSGEDWRRQAGFHGVDQGENVWLVKPNDVGVFQGSSEREGIPCVHPVQVYLDLKHHPERSTEAAEVLRQELLTFTRDA